MRIVERWKDFRRERRIRAISRQFVASIEAGRPARHELWVRYAEAIGQRSRAQAARMEKRAFR